MLSHEVIHGADDTGRYVILYEIWIGLQFNDALLSRNQATPAADAAFGTMTVILPGRQSR
jgi:hypothetical protein